MIILNALTPDFNKLGEDLKKSAGTDYSVSIYPSDGIIKISDIENIFICTITEKEQDSEIEITFNTYIPNKFTEKYIDGIIIPAYVDPEIQNVSNKIKEVLSDKDDKRFIPSKFAYENKTYFLVTTLDEGVKLIEFKIEISKQNDLFKLHTVFFHQYPNDKQIDIINEIKGIQNYINL